MSLPKFNIRVRRTRRRMDAYPSSICDATMSCEPFSLVFPFRDRDTDAPIILNADLLQAKRRLQQEMIQMILNAEWTVDE